jgi:hypothetical protein
VLGVLDHWACGTTGENWRIFKNPGADLLRQQEYPDVMAKCNVCGSDDFVPGPNGRLTLDGAPPRCVGCGSLERHRALRACLQLMPREFLSWRRAIHFAPECSLEPTWFRSYEKSRFGGENSIDLQAINRSSDSYDFISLSSVLEFVADDLRAFRELLRIGSSRCIVHCTFTPFAGGPGSHTAEPRGTFGRYHVFGTDVYERLEAKAQNVITMVATARDPVTGSEQTMHFFCRHAGDAQVLQAALVAGEPSCEVSLQTV